MKNDKDIPKEPVYANQLHERCFKLECPTCGKWIRKNGNKWPMRCEHCGQLFYWRND